ncbi:MAG: DUF2336 domain-containing protein [Ancalomicrobiaceae bacterium]|nr:DUF2336 domain-containing protein [Ancalomicrobiaceae bacterium]
MSANSSDQSKGSEKQAPWREATVTLRPEPRAGLVRELAMLFTLRQEHRRDDINVFEELMGELYAGSDEAERADVARILAERSDLPPSVAAMIAMDDFAIAEPILRHGRTLATIDRIRIVGGRSDQHRTALAERADLEEAVISALFIHAGSETIAALASNPNLTLTEAQTDRLVERVIATGQSLGQAADAIEVSPGRLIDLFFDVDRASRRRALLGFDMETAFRRIEKRGRRTPPRRQSGLEAELLEAVIAGDEARLVRLLAQALDIEDALASRIAQDRGGEPLVVALSAAGLDVSDATSILVRFNPAFGWTYQTIRDLVRLYGEIGWRAAEAILDRWSARTGRRLTGVQRQLDDAQGVRGTERPPQTGRERIVRPDPKRQTDRS